MKKFLQLALLYILVQSNTNGFTQEVVYSAGNYFETSGVQLSWTLGEPIIETVFGSENILTQGFHQSKLIATPVFLLVQNDEISVFPNPTKDIVNIQFNGSHLLNSIAGLYSSEGKLLKLLRLEDEKTVLYLKEFPNGNYLLKITMGNTLLQTYKLVKMY